MYFNCVFVLLLTYNNIIVVCNFEILFCIYFACVYVCMCVMQKVNLKFLFVFALCNAAFFYFNNVRYLNTTCKRIKGCLMR